MGLTGVAAATPKFIFDYGANLYKIKERVKIHEVHYLMGRLYVTAESQGKIWYSSEDLTTSKLVVLDTHGYPLGYRALT